MPDLSYMTRGNKAAVLTLITCLLIICSSIIVFVRPDQSSGRGARAKMEGNISRGNGGIFNHNSTSRLSPVPDVTPPSSTTAPTLVSKTLNPVPQPTTATSPLPAPIQRPVAIFPSLSAVIPNTEAPISILSPPKNAGSRVYPSATVYECDWAGQRVAISTKTAETPVIRLCIEAPPPRGQANLPRDPVAIDRLDWFTFTREERDDNQRSLHPLMQHAVIQGLPDPFGRTVTDCPSGAIQCKIATLLRPSFFEQDALLLGQGELLLKFKQNNTPAGMSPVSIAFPLSSKDKNNKQPLQLGRAATLQDPSGHP